MPMTSSGHFMAPAHRAYRSVERRWSRLSELKNVGARRPLLLRLHISCPRFKYSEVNADYSIEIE